MDVQLFVQSELPNGKGIQLPVGVAGVFSSRSPDKQTPNEDAAAIIPVGQDAAVLAVADGLGGMPAGEQASAVALRELIAAVQAASTDASSLRAAILNGLENANRTIQGLGVGAATTMVVVEIQGRTVRPYHVGDSMILVVGQRGKLKLQTVPHSPVGYAVEAGMLNENEALHHAQRHVVSNVLGTADMRIEIGSSIELAPRDTLLLSSDGLFDNLRLDEIVQRIRKGPLRRVVATLAEDCRQRMQTTAADQPSKPDDLTFVLFRCR